MGTNIQNKEIRGNKNDTNNNEISRKRVQKPKY